MGRPQTGPESEIFAFQQATQQIKEPLNVVRVLQDERLMLLHARGDCPLLSRPSCA